MKYHESSVMAQLLTGALVIIILVAASNHVRVGLKLSSINTDGEAV